VGHDVFISYAAHGNDEVVANAVCARLEQQGIRCWIAPRDVGLSPHSRYPAAIAEGIRESRALVLVFSGNANRSNIVVLEVERAVAQGIPIIPFRIEDVVPAGDMEILLAATNWLDALTPPLEKHLGELVDRVRVLIDPPAAQADRDASAANEGKPAALPGPGPKRGPGFRRWMIALIAVAVIAAVAVGIAVPLTRSPAPPSAIRVTVKMVNSGEAAVSIRPSGKFYLTKLGGDGAVEVTVPEDFALLNDGGQEAEAGLVEIKPGDHLLTAQIPISYLRTLKTGEWDIFLSFTRADGTSFASDSMPFTEEALAENSLPADTSK
jgi:hypothetical protein